MFTGIIEETGQIISKGQRGNSLTIGAKKVLEDVHLGDSIAVNGVCLTAAVIGKDSFTADVMGETIKRSNLGELKIGSSVNLERAMPANGRFGGHIVSGHIDGTGIISAQKKDEIAIWLTISASNDILRYIVEKGSIAIDGISLTVAAVSKTDFRVSIIPHTGEQTTLIQKKIGELVNLECDIIGKYVEKLMFTSDVSKKSSTLNKDFLTQNGFI